MRPQLRAALLGSGSAAAVVNPDAVISALFANGEVGAWYDPSDLSTLWKDTAGTDPVTAASDVVARIDDKSGNGKHLTQATEASRPAYGTSGGLHWMTFDGTDDSLATASINFTVTDEISVFVGVRKLSDAAAGSVVELGTGGIGSMGILAPPFAVPRYRFFSSGGTVANADTASSFAAPVTSVITGLGNISGDTAKIRVNGVELANTTTDQGAASSYAAGALTVGRRGGTSLPFNGRIYALIVLGRTATADEITAVEAWMNEKTGAF